MTDPNNRPSPASAAQSLAMRPLYSRVRWERALLASALHENSRLVGLVLSHLAGDAGHIPPGRIQDSRRMAPQVGLKPRFVIISKAVLEAEGFIERPPAGDWTADVGRPITLTMPTGRQEPPHTGGHR